MRRKIYKKIISDLQKKMVFIVGPRQVGKTWLAKEVMKEYKNPIYLNYDNSDHQEIIKGQAWLSDVDLIVFDEIHKMPKWKNYLKGVYDTKLNTIHILVTGSAGTGKTTFGLQFLYYGVKTYNEPGILISFEESKESYYRHNSEYGWDFKELEKKGLFKVLEYKPHQVGRLLDQGGGPIRDAIQQMKAKRLVIDSITSYSLLFKDEYQQRENILKFFELIRKWGCTSIIISEMAPKEAETAKGSIGFLVDAIISLYYEKKEEKDVRVHSLEILKMRGTRHTNKVCALNFEKEGIKIYADIEIF